MFDSATYVRRRNELKQLVKSGVIILFGNNESPANFPNNGYYPFRQDSSFLYYFGLQRDGLVGVIDIDEVVNKHPGMANARQQAANLSRQKENEAKAAADKESDQAKKAQIIQQKRMELVKEQQALMDPIYRECQQAARDVAAKQNLTLVLNKSIVLIGGTDITQDVIQQLAKVAATKK